jgi:hypothetical protein
MVYNCDTLLQRKLNLNFLLASMKTLICSDNPSSNPLQRVYSDGRLRLKKLFRKPPMIFIPKAGHECTLEKIDL